jgi:septum site-determining protein MinC
MTRPNKDENFVSETSVTETPSRHIRFKGRSFPVLALELEPPLENWMERLDAYLACFPVFFKKKPIVVDVAKLEVDRERLVELIENLNGRGIKILGLTGVESSWAGDDLPPILTGGKAAGEVEAEKSSEVPAKLSPQEASAFEDIAKALSGGEPQPSSSGDEAASPALPLIVNAPVRSGQTIFYPEGDVTVIGSVASGADVIAGGSIHIYGALRGRAIAGANGEMRARIFCRRLEAELLAVGGVYMTADEIEASVHNQPVHVWLENESVKIGRLD